MTEMHLAEITIAYGMTESSPGITMTPRDSSVAQRSQTVGPVLPELEVKIVDPVSGRRLRVGGKRGELCCRRLQSACEGLLQQPEATRAAIRRGGLACTPATKEASIPDGCSDFTGRIKDIIIRGG